MDKLASGVFLAAILIGGLILASTLFFGTVHASTDVSGIITSDSTWTQAGSPYTLTGNLLVENGVELTIDAGTTVNLGSYYIKVQGTLIARGSNTDQIHLNGGEIHLQTSEGCIIENAVLELDVLISGSSKINNNSINSRIVVGSYGIISNNEITGNIMVSGSNRQILHNTISGGVEIRGSPVISYNSISDGISAAGEGTPTISNNTVKNGIITYGACSPKILYNNIEGGVDLGGGESIVSYNNIRDGISLNYGSSNISNNNINGGSVGISLLTEGTLTEENVIISNNVISGCTTAGIYGLPSDSVGKLSATINGNLIKNNNFGISIDLGANATIEKNLIIGNTYGIAGGKMIRYNTVANNDIGVVSLGTIIYNNIQNNNYDISLSLPGIGGSVGGNATYNWWGTTDSQEISKSMYDYQYDFYLDTVNFTPFLTAPNPEAPTTEYTPTTLEIPEFPSLIILAPFIITTLLALLYFKKRKH